MEGHSLSRSTPELLAPAGQMESFWAAVENGADAIYLGLKQLSARASATNFSLEELAVLLPFAHKRNVSIYVALNSLLTASDFPKILDLLQSLSDLKVDALIVQDPGIFFLAREYFPSVEAPCQHSYGDSQPCRSKPTRTDGRPAGGFGP